MTGAVSVIVIGTVAAGLAVALVILIYARRQLFESRRLYLAMTTPPAEVPVELSAEADTGDGPPPVTDDSPRGPDVPAPAARAVVSVLPDNIVYWELDPATGAFELDPRWLQRFGFRQKPTLSSWLDAMAREDSEWMREQLRRLQAGAIERVCVNYRLTIPAGSHLDIETRVDIAGTDEHGRVLRLRGTHMVTPGSDGADALLNETTGNHEVANHLSTVLGYTDLLEKTHTDERQRFYIEEIARAGRCASAQLSSMGSETVTTLVDRLASEFDIESTHYESGLQPAISANVLGHILRPICTMRSRNAGRKATLRLISGEPAPAGKVYCSSCGMETGTDCYCILLQDDGEPVLREHLPYVLGTGFDTATLAARDHGTDMDVAHAVEVLHELGGHINLSSCERRTDIRICLPSRPDDIPVGRL